MQVTKEQVKLTAHGMWSSLLSDELHSIFYPLRPQKKAEMENIHNMVISTVLKHETTRLRVHVDEMIARLQAWDKTIKSLESEYKQTSWFRFKHRSKLKSEHFRSIGVREAFQNAVLVLTNTPPVVNKEISQPQMTVSK